MADALAAALDRGLAYLVGAQRPSGEIPVCIAMRGRLDLEGQPDPAIFPSLLAAHCLSFAPEAQALRRRALAFVAAERCADGLWRHWLRDHPHAARLPPDADDTSCASQALAAAGMAGAAPRELLLANRNRRGLFLTWIVPRLRPRGWRHLRATAPQLLRLPGLTLFFRKTSAAPGDVDAVVNANCLFYLGRFPGSQAVVDFLLQFVRSGRETDADKWYDNPFAIWYFFARALAPLAPEAGALIERRLAGASPASALEHALALCTRLSIGLRPTEGALAALLSLQREDGSWPAAALYHGGRRRRPDGGFDAPHPDTPHWGSAALTTAFAVEALSRLRSDRS